MGVVDEVTGGLGVQHLVDLSSAPVPDTTAPGRTVSTVLSSASMLPKRKALQLLAVHGCWVTFCSDLQLDPPESRALQLKDAALAFAFAPAWGCSPNRQGVHLHMIAEALRLAAEGQLVVPVGSKQFGVAEANEALEAALHAAQRDTHTQAPAATIVVPWKP